MSASVRNKVVQLNKMSASVRNKVASARNKWPQLTSLSWPSLESSLGSHLSKPLIPLQGRDQVAPAESA